VKSKLYPVRFTLHDSLAEQTGFEGPTVTNPVTTPSIRGTVVSELVWVIIEVVELLPNV